MKLKAIVIIALAALCVGARAADTYNIDPVHSTVGFSIAHLVINNVQGKFGEFPGTVTVDNNAVQETKGTIQTKSVDTGVAMRDKDLRGANLPCTLLITRWA